MSSVGKFAAAVVVLLAVLVVLRIAVPAGARATPVVLLLLGGVIWSASSGMLDTIDAWQFLGGLILAFLGAALLISPRTENSIRSPDPVHTARVVLLSRRLRFVGTEPRAHERIQSYGALVTSDFSGALAGEEDILELSVSAIAGRVDLVFPPTWFLIPGRLLVGVGGHVEGTFDDSKPVEYLGSVERDDVRELVASDVPDDQAADSALPSRPTLYPVVLNVTTICGRVAISRRA